MMTYILGIALSVSPLAHAGDPALDPLAPPGAGVAPPPPSPRYRVGPGDVLKVQVFGEAGLSGSFPVDDAGQLTYPLLGQVSVEDLTATQVADLLRRRLDNGFVVGPDVTVWLETYHSQPVQVLGAVAKPGLYHLDGPTTVLELLSKAGGVSLAGVNEIRITHGARPDEVTVLPYDRLLTRSEANLEVSGGDIVFVPESLVSVMGEVKEPGDVAFREDLTISSCIAAAGGAMPTANLRRVTILRGDERIRVNVRKILNGRAPDVPMQTGDRIFVEESVF